MPARRGHDLNWAGASPSARARADRDQQREPPARGPRAPHRSPGQAGAPLPPLRAPSALRRLRRGNAPRRTARPGVQGLRGGGHGRRPRGGARSGPSGAVGGGACDGAARDGCGCVRGGPGSRPRPRPRPRSTTATPSPRPSPRRGRGRTADLGGRASKLVTRSLPAASAAGLAVLGARAASVAGLTVAAGALALVAGGALAYRRRGPDRSPCVTCPERERPQVCSGLAPLARREKAFSRLAARLLRTVPRPPAAR